MIDALILVAKIDEANAAIPASGQFREKGAHCPVFVIRNQVQPGMLEGVPERDRRKIIPIEIDPSKSLLRRQQHPLDATRPEYLAHTIVVHVRRSQPELFEAVPSFGGTCGSALEVI